MLSSALRFWLMVLLLLGLSACSAKTGIVPTVTSSAALAQIATAPTTTNESITCADLDVAWAANDWPRVLHILQSLRETQSACGAEPLQAKEYAAHFNYATALEVNGQRAEAIEQYRAALAINMRGREALNALVRLNALPTLPPPGCLPTEVPPYSATPGDFVTVSERGFTLKGEPFYLRGFNYFPRHAPWEAFLTGADTTELSQELDLIAKAGFNTLRIALWYDPLFTCAPEKATPNADGFARLDAMIGLARDRGLKLIVALNDLPDLYFRPLYSDYARYDAQTAFIVNRYRDEAAILAWDLRNEPDLDYGADGRPAVASSEEVLKWLTHIADVVKLNDQKHLITVGWWGDATNADEVVDFLSFHHWTDAAKLQQRVDTLRAASSKPIVLEEVGYPAWDQDSETRQAKSLQEVISAAERSGIAGWLIWTAFDFVPPPGQTTSQEYFFGVWRTDLTPKPALNELLRIGP
jgi:hypothetical protein